VSFIQGWRDDVTRSRLLTVRPNYCNDAIVSENHLRSFIVRYIVPIRALKFSKRFTFRVNI